jgi:hypothetical protein
MDQENLTKTIAQDTYGSANGLELRVIDRGYPLSEAPEAIRYLAEGHARGITFISLQQNG